MEVPVVESIPLRGLREVTTRGNVEALNIPQLTSSSEIDMAEFVKFRRSLVPEIEKKYGIHVTYTHFFLKAAAQTLVEYPILNSRLVNDEIRVYGQINIGLVTSLPPEDIMVAPVVRDVDKHSIVEVAREANKLVKKVRTYDERTGRYGLRREDGEGITFCLSNMGMFGDKGLSKLLLTPEYNAILLTGVIEERPVVRNGKIIAKPMMNVTMTINHRVRNAVTLTRFLQSFAEILENPQELELGI